MRYGIRELPYLSDLVGTGLYLVCILLMNRRNNIRSITVPWGIPDITVDGSEIVSPEITNCFQSTTKLSNHTQIFESIPFSIIYNQAGQCQFYQNILRSLNIHILPCCHNVLTNVIGKIPLPKTMLIWIHFLIDL